MNHIYRILATSAMILDRIIRRQPVIVLFTALLSVNVFSQTLWYTAPAEKWMQALPVGNGRLGMMVYGDPREERLALNESSLWSGEYNPDANPLFGRERLDSLRSVFMRGDIEEGNRIAAANLTGDISRFGTHLPMGDIRIRMDIDSFSSYRRSLDLSRAIVSSSFKAGDISYTTESFASNPDDVLVWHIKADKKRAVSLSVSLQLLREAEVKTENGMIVYTGKVSFPKQGSGGVSFRGRVKVAAEGGMVTASDTSVVVRGADEVTITADIQTDYGGSFTASGLPRRAYSSLIKRHVNDFAPLFGRAKLTLCPEADTIPTDRRLQAVKNGGVDPYLEALFFNFSRYLFLSASRRNSPLPVALQGMFNDNLACNMPWTNDYHLDINTEQNYWLSNIGNMHESNEPLLHYVEHLAKYGAETAEKVYGCRGWCAHTTANIFGFTAPSAAIGWGLFPTAGSWLTTHLWTHYLYTLDTDWLQRAYPLIRGNAQFLLDYMVLDSVSGYLLTGPSISPENGFLYNGKYMCASMMPTVDRVLVFEILSACAQAANVLDIDHSFADSCLYALALLPPLQTGSDGGLREWFEDYTQAVPNHRHTSHLLALYPFRQISLERTPQLAEAALVSLENRMNTEGWEDTEWSRANAVAYYARLRMAHEAHQSVLMQLRQFTAGNLMTFSPAGIAMAEDDIFCFDGNTATAAAMAEMLVQADGDDIYVLPCLPEEWSSGSVSGLCLPGGIEVDISWQDGGLTRLALTRRVSGGKSSSGSRTIHLPSGETRILGKTDRKIELHRN